MSAAILSELLQVLDTGGVDAQIKSGAPDSISGGELPCVAVDPQSEDIDWEGSAGSSKDRLYRSYNVLLVVMAHTAEKRDELRADVEAAVLSMEEPFEPQFGSQVEFESRADTENTMWIARYTLALKYFTER